MTTTTIKPPSQIERYRAMQFTGTALCAKCQVGKKRQANCKGCKRAVERLTEVREWLRVRGRLETNSAGLIQCVAGRAVRKRYEVHVNS